MHEGCTGSPQVLLLGKHVAWLMPVRISPTVTDSLLPVGGQDAVGDLFCIGQGQQQPAQGLPSLCPPAEDGPRAAAQQATQQAAASAELVDGYQLHITGDAMDAVQSPVCASAQVHLCPALYSSSQPCLSGLCVPLLLLCLQCVCVCKQCTSLHICSSCCGNGVICLIPQQPSTDQSHAGDTISVCPGVML